MDATSDTEPRTRRPRVIDLYSGAGGLSLGMEQAGFDVVAAAELDPVHVLTHRVNMPETPVLWRDLGHGPVEEVARVVQSVASSEWESTGPREGSADLDAVVGGPPCQGFSSGGVRDPSDLRNDQLLRFVDLVVALQPKVFCLENVAGLLEPRFERLRNEAVRRLVEIGGYRIAGLDGAVNAADYGVPQNRRRVLVLGSRVGAAPTLQSATGSLITVGEALDGLPDITRYRTLVRYDSVELNDGDRERLLNSRSFYSRLLVGQEADHRDLSRPRIFDTARLTNSLRTVHLRRTIQRFARTEQGAVEPFSRLFRLDPAGQARTLRAGTGSDRGSHTSPRPIHPVKSRVITVREAARLHGFPDWFQFHRTNWHGHRQIGNSVPPPLAAEIGRALMRALGTESLPSTGDPFALQNIEWLRLSPSEAALLLREQEIRP